MQKKKQITTPSLFRIRTDELNAFSSTYTIQVRHLRKTIVAGILVYDIETRTVEHVHYFEQCSTKIFADSPLVFTKMLLYVESISNVFKEKMDKIYCNKIQARTDRTKKRKVCQ